MGQKTSSWSPGRLIWAGRAYLSEDRKTEGLLTSMSTRENLTLASLGKVARLGLLSRAREQKAAGGLIAQLAIVARSAEQLVATLSGGNQQKCVLEKWLATAPRLLIPPVQKAFQMASTWLRISPVSTSDSRAARV